VVAGSSAISSGTPEARIRPDLQPPGRLADDREPRASPFSDDSRSDRSDLRWAGAPLGKKAILPAGT
jgi:hypothetical protein